MKSLALRFMRLGIVSFITMALCGISTVYALQMHRQYALIDERVRKYDILRDAVIVATHPDGWVRARFIEPMGSYEYVQFRITRSTDITERVLIAEGGTLLGFDPPRRIAISDVSAGSYVSLRLTVEDDGSLNAARFTVIRAK